MKFDFSKNILFVLSILMFITGSCQKKHDNYPDDLKVVIIRHAEKPDEGNNLSCQGFNRSVELAEVLHRLYGKFDEVYAAQPNVGSKTTSARMFQTISPYAIKYDISVNTEFKSGDVKELAKDLEQQTGTVLVVWEHSTIARLVRELGIRKEELKWPDDDYDTIWTVTFSGKKPKLSVGSEGLSPQSKCTY